MTAPGNSALLVTLLAVFVACTAYAAGRLHQRYQMERDREEAYRDGYDTATRSVFSLAARVIAPRRAVRASVPALPAVSGSPVLGGSATMPGPEPAGDPAAPAGSDEQASGAAAPGSPDGAVSGTAMPSEGLAPHPVPGYPGLLRRAALPGTIAKPVQESTTPECLGFPAPPPPPPRVVPEAAAVGGVVYQPFPDPRRPGDEPAGLPPAYLADVPAGLPPVHLANVPAAPPRPGAGAEPTVENSPSEPPSEPPSESSSEPPAGAEPASAGRHTVPDELVRATTYRLPPDRIFRAKVPDSTLPEDPTTRLSVPKPRRH